MGPVEEAGVLVEGAGLLLSPIFAVGSAEQSLLVVGYIGEFTRDISGVYAAKRGKCVVVCRGKENLAGSRRESTERTTSVL